MADNHCKYFNPEEAETLDPEDDSIFRKMKYARIIDIIAKEQNISCEEATDMLYSSPLFGIIDDGTADLICRSDIYLAGEIIRVKNYSSQK